ncbi:DUF1178 family protein [Rhodovulum sp. DZ06]|uniref:DUF1178 family protein n=1 Tax=Rhodovulum sp. DZ06 TaxID=3425126 RepID=UPI003D34608C
MIRYALKCADGHHFESWFASSAAFDALKQDGLLSCAICGGEKVEKAIMAPAVSAATRKDAAPAPAAAPAAPAAPAPAPAPGPGGAALSAPSSQLEAAIRALREKVEANAENVGRRFAREARAIHEGEADARPIYGEASGAEVKELAEEGIEVAPLPWTTRRDA